MVAALYSTRKGSQRASSVMVSTLVGFRFRICLQGSTACKIWLTLHGSWTAGILCLSGHMDEIECQTSKDNEGMNLCRYLT